MKKIDIISKSPNNFIFQKDYNKTDFGGFLSLIYIIVGSIIILFYFSRFLLNDNYEIVSFISGEMHLEDDETLYKFNKSELYNPTLKLYFTLEDEHGEQLSDRFIIYDLENNAIINRDTLIDKKANGIHIVILYNCFNETNCKIDKKDQKILYQFRIGYQEFEINSQSDIPITRPENNDFYSYNYVFSSYIKLRTMIKWHIIRYEDDKGFFDIFKKRPINNAINEDDIYIGGKYETFNTHIISNSTEFNPFENTFTRLMFMFETMDIRSSNVYSYENHKRKKKSLLDTFANVLALLISIYNGLSFFVFKVYSKSFDKYKIIENILLNHKQKLSKNENRIKKIMDTSIKDSLIKDSINEQNENLIMKDSKENSKIDINDNEINDDNKLINKELEDKERVLPKRSFFDYIINFFYCNCCKYQKQEIITACNNIILKYYSIENILYNQIILENFFQDYKWNNPELKNILNNNSFEKIISISLNN